MRAGNRVWRSVCLLSVASLIFFTSATSIPANEETRVVFRKLDNREMTEFANRALRQWYEDMNSGMGGTPSFRVILRTKVAYAEVDLNDDGTPERFLQIDDALWCGTAGCQSFIFRKTTTGFEKICEADLGDSGTPPRFGALVLPEKENGYHLIDTGSAIIHWHAEQAYDSGRLCWEDEYKG